MWSITPRSSIEPQSRFWTSWCLPHDWEDPPIWYRVDISCKVQSTVSFGSILPGGSKTTNRARPKA
jgi:hypothetical protein